MIKAVLFDLDGTMLDRNASVQLFLENQFKRFEKQLKGISEEAFIRRFNELEKRGYIWKDVVYQQLVEEYKLTEVTWETLLDDYINEFQHFCVPFDHLVQTLEELKAQGKVLGIISNGIGEFQMNNIESLGIKSYFDVILISAWEGVKKPDPEIFQRAVKKLKLLPEECVFIGDHPENDVVAAMNAGMKGIWKQDEGWNHRKADGVINDLAEIPQVISKLE
ncbi:HAD family hydrolase [Alkalicoccus daliensis]|uniref:Putative hydrolase of the HAD superfamily n=1 Tax=Alkalicoccus daliensis TaxID=745820 RepID=A0A1H0D5W5_9BACI|nr:HAD family hydrolase [Alkalicoccus daliensis]SDN65465.1 putative hydrolase of the HAD superfamily [Alkalicoccus daliensis]